MTVGEIEGFPIPTMPQLGQDFLTPGFPQTRVPSTRCYRGFKVTLANAGTNVILQMVDGSFGYWENVQAGQDYEACFVGMLTSTTLPNIGAVTTTATNLIALR